MSEPLVAIVDYGAGNLLSVSRAVAKVGGRPVITSDPATLLAAPRVILPGVGAFPKGMAGLASRDLIGPLTDYAAGGGALLGICLGMQILMTTSEEFGSTEGLGLIEGTVERIPRESTGGVPIKVPHVGWSRLRVPAERESAQADGLPGGESAYFVHSFQARPSDPDDLLLECRYGGWRIAAAVGRGSVVGCQFHPEKSGPTGLSILARFVRGMSTGPAA